MGRHDWLRRCAKRPDRAAFGRPCILCGSDGPGPVIPTAAHYCGGQGVICLGCLRTIVDRFKSKSWRGDIAAFERAYGTASRTPLATISRHVYAAFPPPPRSTER